MNLTDLKTKPTQELLDIAKDIGLDNIARQHKQDIIFSILKRHAKSGEDISGDGVLEILQDGFGFAKRRLLLPGRSGRYLRFPPARFAASICVPAIPYLARFVRQRTANAILLC